MKILVDTREKKPVWEGPFKKQTLIVGDYTTELLQETFAIERKSPGDLYGSIIQGHARFRRELIRGLENGIRISIYVECSRTDFINKRFYGGDRRQCPGSKLDKIIRAMEIRYEVEFIWCSSRADLRFKIFQRLRKEEDKIRNMN